jgi:hypothetical protein
MSAPIGPHPDNLRGELALEQLHHIKDALWPGLQSDIDRNRVVVLPEVEIIRCRTPLTPAGPRLGIEVEGADRPAPLSPGVETFRGRHRAWVLPASGVAVAVEPLDDEASYLRQHRRDLLALQDVEDAQLVPLAGLRRGEASELGATPLEQLYALAKWLINGRVRAYFEGPFERRRAKIDPTTEPFAAGGYEVYATLVVGRTYRIRPTKSLRRIIEPVGAEGATAGVGPYR